MTLLVGLGNPGPAYAATRHNLGRMVVARAAAQWAVSLVARGPARQGTGLLHRHPVTLALPDTLMNVSGKAVEALLAAHDVRSCDVIVVHDDVDLPVGHLRIKSGGGAGGHRGVQSIRATLGTDAFVRLKIGIGRPPSGVDPADFVLAPLTRTERDRLEPVLALAVESLECVIQDGVREAMNRYHRRASE